MLGAPHGGEAGSVGGWCPREVDARPVGATGQAVSDGGPAWGSRPAVLCARSVLDRAGFHPGYQHRDVLTAAASQNTGEAEPVAANLARVALR